MRLNKVKSALRGEVKLTTAAREALRRSRVAALSRRERATLDKERGLELKRAYAEMSPAELLAHLHGKTRIRGFLNPPFFQSVLNSLPLRSEEHTSELQSHSFISY